MVNSHPRSAELDRLSIELKEHGYQSDPSWIMCPRQDSESAEQEEIPFATNHFLFVDRVTKVIADIPQCEIIVRDANRAHHFAQHPSSLRSITMRPATSIGTVDHTQKN